MQRVGDENAVETVFEQGTVKVLSGCECLICLCELQGALRNLFLKPLVCLLEGLLALLQIPEEELIGRNQPHLDDRSVNQIEGDDFEKMSDQVRGTVDAQIGCEGKLGGDGCKDRAHKKG